VPSIIKMNIKIALKINSARYTRGMSDIIYF